MRTSRAAFSTAAALRRVFAVPIEQSRIQSLRQSSHAAIAFTSRFPSYLFQQQRSLTDTTKIARSRLPRNDEIEDPFIQVVTEDGILRETQSTAAVLRSIDRDLYSLVMVSAGEEGTLPVCRIMSKKSLYEASKKKASIDKKAPQKPKTIELNWAIAPNDIQHRMNNFREFLGRGFRVEVILAPKKKGKASTEEGARELIKLIRATAAECEGSKEDLMMEGGWPAQTTLHFNGKRTIHDGNDNKKEATKEKRARKNPPQPESEPAANKAESGDETKPAKERSTKWKTDHDLEW